MFISTIFFWNVRFIGFIGWMILIYYDAMQSRHCTRKWSSTKPTKTTKLTNYSVFDISIRFCMKKRFSATTATITAYRFFLCPWVMTSIHLNQVNFYSWFHIRCSVSQLLYDFVMDIYIEKIERKSMSIWTEQLNFRHFFSMLGSQCAYT